MWRKCKIRLLSLILAGCLTVGMLSYGISAEEDQTGEPVLDIPVSASGDTYGGDAADSEDYQDSYTGEPEENIPAVTDLIPVGSGGDEENGFIDEGEQSLDFFANESFVTISIKPDEQGDTELFLISGIPVSSGMLLAGVSAVDENGDPVEVTVSDTGGLELQSPEPQPGFPPEAYVITYEAVHPISGEVFAAIRDAYVTIGVTPTAAGDPIPSIDGFSYIEGDNPDEAIVTGYSGMDTEIIIPSNIGAYTVVAVEGATGRWPGITKITIPNTVESIGDESFNSCITLEEVVFDDGASLNRIGISAFANCLKLSQITIPASVESIGSSAFSWCIKLTSAEFEQGSQLSSIEASLFGACRELTSITIPASVTSIEMTAFFTSANTGDGQAAYSKLTHINVEAGNNYFSSIDGVLYNKDLTEIIYHASARVGEDGTYKIPDGVIRIAQNCFSSSKLKKIIVPKSVKTVGFSAFSGSRELEIIEFPVDSNLTKLENLCISSSPKLVLFLPPSLPLDGISPLIFSGFGEDSHPRNEVVFFVYYDSKVAQWCREMGYLYALRPSSAEMQANPPELMYEYIPYQFTAKTLVPGNAGLTFWLEDKHGNPVSLPEGLKLADGGSADNSGLTPGTIYGAPLDYKTFVNGIEFVMRAKHEDDRGGMFTAGAKFQLKLAPRPGNQELETINKFAFIQTPEYGDGKIEEVITGKAEDYDKPQILFIDGDYSLFDSFWIDGVRKERGKHYLAEEGSTRITVLAQTFKELENGEHTAAAAFRVADGDNSHISGTDLDIVAQTFSVNLANKPNVPVNPPTLPNAENNNANSGNTTGRNGSSDTNSDDWYPPDVSEPDVSDSENAVSETENTQDNDNSESPAPVPANTAAGSGSAPEGGSSPEDSQRIAEPYRGTGTVGGLSMDSSGKYSFSLDGSGNPMELRIDLPYDSFNDMLIDGVTWIRGVDYTAKSGSTILTIQEERLEQLQDGEHTFEAVFDGESVKLTFTLSRANAQDTQAPSPDVSEPGSDNASAGGILPIAAVPAVLLLTAAIIVWRVRSRRRA